MTATQRESNRGTGQEICVIPAVKELDHETALIILTKNEYFWSSLRNYFPALIFYLLDHCKTIKFCQKFEFFLVTKSL
jgi:hypothetical protein